MKIGFLGFGEVASTLSEGLQEHGATVATCVEGRSTRTKNLAGKSGVNLYKTNIELAEVSDILISTVTPFQAIKVAQEVGKYTNGIYVDINNVSPKTTKKALSFIDNGKIVDASIIGSVKKVLNALIIASGEYANQFTELNNYGMNIKVIGGEIGQASAIKMFRSSFTKGISALLFETIYSAYKMGIDEEVLKYIAKTECEGFKDSSISRIISSSMHAKRRGEEMEEVIELISEYIDPKMSNATEKFFKSLYKNVNDLKTRPGDYKEVFKLMDKK
jgi:3-hydroxyisobutyrate dehydrogenase-like beta-hydroxyacid dehydrogenase